LVSKLGLAIALWALIPVALISDATFLQGQTSHSISSLGSTTLRGHLPPWITFAHDNGSVAPDMSIPNVVILLSQSPDRFTRMQELLKAQLDISSPDYHHWLTPDEIGSHFGAADRDIASICAWLESFGLHTEIARSKLYISVSGTAAQLSAAFKADLHSFTFNRVTRYSIVADPAIPTQFSPLIRYISGLTEQIERTEHKVPSDFSSPVRDVPAGTSSTGKHLISPGDFAIIYDINPVYNAGYSGAGQSIAVVGRSRVENADLQNFASLTNLSLKNPAVVLPPGSVDPGETGDDDQVEATLDVSRASSVAPQADISLVINAASNGGIGLPMRYVIDNRTASIMTVSFYGCELDAGAANTYFYDALFTQGAAEGITIFVSSGDGGVDSCESPDSVPNPVQTASINYLCASANLTCVGGTEFNDSASPGSYWATTNSKGFVSALSYIPEGAFNESTDLSTGAFQIFAGGGGVSTFVTKPAWQAGVNVPADGYRDVPDIAFSSSGHDGYLICLAFQGYPCVPNIEGETLVHSVAGTSAATPSMAGIQALLDQEVGTSLGNINPLLYALAANPSNSVFHDVTVASSGISNCTVAIPSVCNNSDPAQSSPEGGIAGYAVDTGFDLATGWGSLDVDALLHAWTEETPLGTVSMGLILSQSLLTYGQSLTMSATVSANGPTPTGTIQFVVNGQQYGVPVTIASAAAGVSFTPFGTTQTNAVVAVYSGDANYGPATSPSVQFVVNPAGTPSFTLSATSITITTPGKSGSSSITISPANGFTGSVNLTCPSTTGVTFGSCNFSPQSVTLAGGSAVSLLTLASVSPSVAQVASASRSSDLTPLPPFTKGTKQLLAGLLIGLLALRRLKRYRGLLIVSICCVVASGIGCSRSVVTVMVVPAMNPGTTQVPISFLVNVAGSSNGSTPTGSVQLFSNGQTIGSAQPLTNGSAVCSYMFTAAGTFAITAEYLGNSSYDTAQSTSVSETITYKNPGTLLGSYSLLVQASSGTLTQTIAVPVQVQ